MPANLALPPPTATPGNGAALLTIAQVAAMLNLSRRGVERLRAAGRLGPQAINFGARCVRFRADEVKAWIAAACPPADRWQAINRSPRQHETESQRALRVARLAAKGGGA